MLPTTTTPVWCHDTADPGLRFWHERRYVEHSIFRPSKLYAFRKQERVRNVNTGLMALYGLHPYEFMPGAKGEPTLVSTRMLLLWATTRFFMSQLKGDAGSRTAKWARVVSDIFKCAADTCETVDTAKLPIIQVGDVSLPVTSDASVNLAPLAPVWPALAYEWDAVASVRDSPIAPLLGHRRVPLRSLFWFLACCCKWAKGPLGNGSMLVQFRAVVTDIVVWLAEIHIHQRIAEASQRVRPPDPAQLVGPKGCKVKMCALARYRMICNIVTNFGSDEVSSTAMGRRHGDAAVMRAMRNRLCLAIAQQELGKSTCVAVNWDGATHGGLDTIVGSIVNPKSHNCYYLRPQAVCVSYARLHSSTLRIFA